MPHLLDHNYFFVALELATANTVYFSPDSYCVIPIVVGDDGVSKGC